MRGSRIALSIGGVNLELEAAQPSATLIVPEEYRPYVVADPERADIYLCVHAGIPLDMGESGRPRLFSARHGIGEDTAVTDCLWSIEDDGQQVFLVSADPELTRYPALAAVLGHGNTQWDLFAEPIEGVLNPLRYPMGHLLIYHLVDRIGGVLVHACGISDASDGYLFCGPSGIGKSTLAALWARGGARVISEDRLIVRRRGEAVHMFSTPRVGESVRAEAPVTVVGMLRQARANTFAGLTGATALSRLLTSCVQFYHQPSHIHRGLDAVTDIAARVPLFDIGFLPDFSIVEAIRNGALH